MDDELKQLDALRSGRMKQIEADLTKWATSNISFDFDPSGTDLYSMMELALAYAKRCAEFRDSIHSLLAKDRLVSATVMARAMIETVGVGSLYVHDMLKLIAEGDRPRLEARFKKYYAGQKQAEIGPVHVNDGLRYLEKIDAEYVAYLNSKYEFMRKAFEAIKLAKGTDKDLTIQEAVSVVKNYDFLSEVSHPNGLGTQFLFPHKPLEVDALSNVRDRLGHSCLVSIWHTRFLIEHLERAQQMPTLYQDAFLRN